MKRGRDSSVVTRYVVGLSFVLAGAYVYADAGADAREQDRRVRTWRAVPAVVGTGEIDSRRIGKTRKTRPRLTYEYQVNGQRFTCREVTPIERWGSMEWSRSVLASHPPGGGYTAFVDPADPARAFLVRSYAFDPYMRMLFATVIGLAGLALVSWGSGDVTAMFVTLLWYTGGIFVTVNYLVNVWPAVATVAKVVLPAYLVAGLIPLVVWQRNRHRRRAARVADWRMLLRRDAAAARRGERVAREGQ